MLSYIDTSGVTTLKKLVQTHGDINIQVLLAGCPVHIETILNRDGFFKEVSSDHVFKSVHDAVSFIRDNNSTVGYPLKPKNQRNGNLRKVVSIVSIDSSISDDNNDIFNEYKVFDSKEDILSDNPDSTPRLAKLKAYRSLPI